MNLNTTMYLYLGILSFAIYLGNNSKECLEFPNGSCSLVDWGGILVHVQVLGSGRDHGGVAGGVVNITLNAVGMSRESTSLSRGRMSRWYSVMKNWTGALLPCSNPKSCRGS